jgi:hypothetical protein
VHAHSWYGVDRPGAKVTLTPLGHAGAQLGVRGRHHLDIDGVLAHYSYPPYAFSLNCHFSGADDS